MTTDLVLSWGWTCRVFLYDSTNKDFHRLLATSVDKMHLVNIQAAEVDAGMQLEKK